MFVGFVFLVTVCVASARGGSGLCEPKVDISDGQTSGTAIIYNGVTYTQDNYYKDGSVTWGCLCKVKTCLRKCCEENKSLDLTKDTLTCVLSNRADISSQLPQIHNIVNVPPKKICTNETTRIQLRSTEYNWTVTENGVLMWEGFSYGYEDFCIANVDDELVAIVCIIPDSTAQSKIYSLGMIISMPFLLATFLVYALIPERNLHQKALMFYVLTLLFGYVCLVTIELSDSLPEALCTPMGFLVLFFFLVSFFWMNVICLDIWFTFSGSRGFIGSKKDSEKKRFLLYCAYAWGVPVLFILVVFFINQFGDTKSAYHPCIGEATCFIKDGLPNLLYFYGPMAILIATNLTLFVMTALKIRKVKKETSMLKHSDSQRHTYEKNKQKFNLYVKLMLAMGVNWSMEVISWAVKWNLGSENVPDEVWYLTDLCNALYGVFIFFIFVFKKKIWTLLQKRYYTFIGKPHLAHSLTTSQATRTSQFSSSTHDTHLDNTNSSVRQRPDEIALNRR